LKFRRTRALTRCAALARRALLARRAAPAAHLSRFAAALQAEKLSGAAIAAFKYNLGVLTSGANLMIAEGDIEPVASLPDYNSLTKEDPSLLTTTVMVKLNGGLGTGMGLEKAKSLLDLKDGNTFLDFIAQQVMNMRTEYKTEIAFMLMNSFATSADTLEHLSKYEKLALPGLDLEFQQNKVRPLRPTRRRSHHR
jgi:hypothetical protein